MSDHEEHGEHETKAEGHSHKERPESSASEHDNDNFEDANDTTAEESKPIPHVESRSLTDRSSNNSSASTPEPAAAHAIAADPESETAQTNGETNDELNHNLHDTTQPKSPLLTSHRRSTASLDNVNLEEEDKEDNSELNGNHEKGDATPTHTHTASKPSLQGLSGILPSVPWGPPPTAPAAPNLPTPPAAPSRKLTGPFSWLRGSPRETVTSPPPTLPSNERRNTASSITTLSSNPEMMLSKLEEGHEADGMRPARHSLKDRFKLLRMREEAGITSLGDGLGLGSPTSLVEDKELPSGLVSPPLASPNPSVDMTLAPGTAVGATAGPSAMEAEAHVDWDLWQSVVYEGPVAVARTSPAELSIAIATGIPNAIRGVVWQVLAQSKNEELESVYRELVVRGTDKDKDRHSGSSGTPSIFQGHTSPTGGEEVISSASSIHSEHSSPATTVTNGMRSPSPAKEKDIESILKAQAASAAEKKKKAKEDAISLQKLEKAIKRDLGARTSFSKFAASAGLQDGLFGLCKAYALFDEGVGYAQGINFLAMPLLFNMPEEEAFGLLVRLMNQYHLRDLFIQDMPGLHMHLYQFERLLEDFEPALYCHLHRRQVTPHLYATQWFLTLFAYRFPLQLVLRIYDLIFSEGLEAILKFGIVLMQKNAATLLGMTDMVALTTFLKDRLFDVYIDASPSAGSILESGFFGSSGASIDKEVYRADEMVHDACEVKITPEILAAYKSEWLEKTKVEKEREAELDSLRSSNNSLHQKVRHLEERVENHDSEHAALATELVRTKVENEELKEENEELKLKVTELRSVIEKQPEEVEERLKTEMERLLKRNQEVHDENTKLEESMAEMEQDLVETKLKWAELNAAHETLQRKMADLRRAVG